MNRPSSPDEGDRRDGGTADGLLAAVRRRLPPEVDVVGLARGPRVAGGLLAGAVALSGCAASPDDVRAQAAASEAHVLEVSRSVLGELAHLGTFKEPTTGAWSGCDDLGGKVLYHVTGRLDPGPDVTGPLADRVVATLEPTGLRLRPVGPGDDPVTLEAVRDDVNVQVTGYTSRAPVLFDISGPCLDVGDLDRELLGEQARTLTVP